VNVDDFVMGPVMAGVWKQKEVWDGTYTLDDLFDWYEMEAVKAENERRYRDSQPKGK
jgi:hypothetical protein